MYNWSSCTEYYLERESDVRGGLRLADARQLVKIDVNKTRNHGILSAIIRTRQPSHFFPHSMQYVLYFQ